MQLRRNENLPTTCALNVSKKQHSLQSSKFFETDTPTCAKQHHPQCQHWWRKPIPSADGWTGEIRTNTKLLSIGSVCFSGKVVWAKTQLLLCTAFGQVTCERLHFLVQDHGHSFYARSQGPCEGTLHGIISQVGSNVPLVVCLGRILSKNNIFTDLVLELVWPKTMPNNRKASNGRYSEKKTRWNPRTRMPTHMLLTQM